MSADMMYGERAPSRQITGVAAVVAVHAALILALVNGLAERRPVFVDQPDIQYIPVTETAPAEEVPVEPPPVDNPEIAEPVIQAPEIPVEVPVDDVIVAEPVTADPPINTAAISAPSPLRSDPRFPLERPDYPATDVRLGHEGIVRLLIYVLPNGRVGDVKIAQSSGYPSLDASAARKAKAAWRFVPATSGSGQAVAAWGTFDVKFELN